MLRSLVAWLSDTLAQFVVLLFWRNPRSADSGTIEQSKPEKITTRYAPEPIADRLEISSEARSRIYELLRTSPRSDSAAFPDICSQCRYYSGNPYLQCAVRPSGIEDETCTDFDPF